MNLIDKLADWGWQAFLALGTACIGWVFHVERKLSGLRLHVAENYVKKPDMVALEQRIAAEFKEVKDGNTLILDVLMQRKVGTKRTGR